MAGSEPERISNNAAGIYAADLLYEQNCKCGDTVIIKEGESWTAAAGTKAWKLVILNNGAASGKASVFEGVSADNLSAASITNMIDGEYDNNTEIMGAFTAISTAVTAEILVIIYMDCLLS